MNKRSKNIIIFLVIAFFIPLLSISIQSIVHNTTLTLIFFGIQAASPTIVAILMLRKEKRFNVILGEVSTFSGDKQGGVESYLMTAF